MVCPKCTAKQADSDTCVECAFDLRAWREGTAARIELSRMKRRRSRTVVTAGVLGVLAVFGIAGFLEWQQREERRVLRTSGMDVPEGQDAGEPSAAAPAEPENAPAEAEKAPAPTENAPAPPEKAAAPTGN